MSDHETTATACDVCLRPKATERDLARWNAEFGDIPVREQGPEPAWARALCWTKPEYRCHCKPGLAPALEKS